MQVQKIYRGSRFFAIDVLRGIAIVLMLVYHICFDLNHFELIEIGIDNTEDDSWYYFSRTILSIFLFCMGISLVISHGKEIKWHKVWKRFWVLSGASVLISIASYQVFPDGWIYFGVIHFIALASLISLVFVHSAFLSIVTGMALFMVYYHGWLTHTFMFEPFEAYLPPYTVDRVSLVPWMVPVLIGIVWGRWGLHQKMALPFYPFLQLLAWAGRHALVIYLLHQPVMFGGIIGLLYLIR